MLRALPLDQVASHGYCFQVDLAWRAVQAGFTVTEVPITFTEREIGESKMSGGIVREALLKVTIWGANHRWDQLPRPVRSRRQVVAERASRRRRRRHPEGSETAFAFGGVPGRGSGRGAPALQLGEPLVEDLFELLDRTDARAACPSGSAAA